MTTLIYSTTKVHNLCVCVCVIKRIQTLLVTLIHPFSSPEMENNVQFVVGIFGNAFALFLFLAPAITFKRIIKKRDTEKFSGVPYVMTLLNTLISSWYGLPFVSPHNLLVATVNGAGAAIELFYVLTFLCFAPKKEKLKIFGLVVLALTVFGADVFISIFALEGEKRKLFCGLAATIFSIIMYASPLTIIRLVIKTKSVEFMPFFLSLFVFLAGTSWLVFGILGKDPFVAIPSAFGCGFGAVQLMLYAIYHDNKRGGASESIELKDDDLKNDDKPHQFVEKEIDVGIERV
ncbi:OLC1v1004267C1 [Oldenlandia corymbosa var. corymbosa]|uniref:Bidirectional sugar transporter SWEET n=1 Tax=Oldenlandia corymbosa var. corymbosa TaxID=529605 RepID=A0AAV1DBV2_OLDCO|nr:OLC1v1004267C1 [Oldenlandia corymbosa var. corymbosa]